MKEYKVISLKDSYTNDRISAAKLEELLNNHAQDGWELKSTRMMNNITSFKVAREELVIILEREKK